jgi:hypothetical protein
MSVPMLILMRMLVLLLMLMWIYRQFVDCMRIAYRS